VLAVNNEIGLFDFKLNYLFRILRMTRQQCHE
jgi:hypothetical protein